MGASESKKAAYADGTRIDIVYGDKKLPPGVFAEKVEGCWTGKKDIKDTVPIKVRELMESKNCMELYTEFINYVANQSKDWLGSYASGEIQKIEQLYNQRFAEHGVHVFYCRKSIYTTNHVAYEKWLEFVDTSIAPDYIPKEYHASKEAKEEAKQMAARAAEAQAKMYGACGPKVG
mmetsp:Transcript_9677/g.23971  ORF Transcript_9677/g.23971 Transcript_9677/m.23971 type:complete len:176 (-) Transcript_9677:584-1111(-)|eukprot:CAMPEP_0206226968 /NCGR_PEP_ID=MMETSP0047_2-20121206/8374_1 /ASSEMBLY_ACC=CAM_ASM_000192 /TAXON_ID=195065 /ORGANISM="Chroomonas mesostigmatica_cf, Strain CCMP1168" /LENGTH=175 /DNA_ID=CAMNT_0053650091 /DNA_START=118 /DNA_END=645 /DNA_ORIENTATION=+